ncbi:unnamed protein product [Strongylus vulgaris]|uniref:Uncharacterized protein n=1 Tax=Strongylus vulgaris TaxID=40348 RepID=A0A3P7K2I1_STRVU|nr:unnamed protein product [Strongylus vulgaris]
MRSMFRLRDPAEYVFKAKHRWVGPIMGRTDDRLTLETLKSISREAKRPRERPPTRWADVFFARMDHLNFQLVTRASERQKEMEAILGPARRVKTGYLSE